MSVLFGQKFSSAAAAINRTSISESHAYRPAAYNSKTRAEKRIRDSNPRSCAEPGVKSEDEEDEVDEEGILLAGGDLESLDPAVLSTLPPSMQLDIMAKLREQRTYGNREGFQKRQAQPQSFSQFQMAEYLKASAVRYPGFQSMHTDILY